MPYIFILAFAFLIAGCTPSNTPNPPSTLPVTKQDTDINDLKITPEDSIVGNFVLKQGMFRNQEITEGYLVIEEIDVNNYGYYYVTIAGKLTPETHTGIFYKKGGKFVQKVIEDSSPSEVRQGKNKSKMSIIDNIHLIPDGDLLRLYVNSNKKEDLLWERDFEEAEQSPKMQETLKLARHEYLKFYQEKCSDCSEFCGDSAYTKVND
ncbi:MAG TPA: hypothetical protein ENK82_00860 [Campylobacterales bacterium]|nr:hypothetical protein [Campylobacterales bacterium]